MDLIECFLFDLKKKAPFTKTDKLHPTGAISSFIVFFNPDYYNPNLRFLLMTLKGSKLLIRRHDPEGVVCENYQYIRPPRAVGKRGYGVSINIRPLQGRSTKTFTVQSKLLIIKSEL